MRPKLDRCVRCNYDISEYEDLDNGERPTICATCEDEFEEIVFRARTSVASKHYLFQRCARCDAVVRIINVGEILWEVPTIEIDDHPDPLLATQVTICATKHPELIP